MKQSSIEWLISFIEPSLTPEQKHFFSMVIERAKAMHKEEIMDANFFGQRLHAKLVTLTMMEDNAEGYYNETFNTNQENLQDSTNGYTYYPQENKTVFNTKEK